MKINNYKSLRIISTAFKVLAIISIIFTFFMTFVNLVHQPIDLNNQNSAFIIFNNLFPILFGMFQALFLYACGEIIILFIDMKEDLTTIKKK